MKNSEKLITGLVVGTVVALFLIPKSRKMLSDAMCAVTDSLKNIMHKTENLVANTGVNKNS